MRTIKFRAWNNKYKQMTRDGFSFDGFDDDCFCDWSALPGGELWYLRDMEVMQFTGLIDRNGKEIYEGDIVKGKYPYGTVGVIKWVDNRGGFMISMIDGLNGGAAYDKEGYKLNSFKCEVIGNIYENPELLHS